MQSNPTTPIQSPAPVAAPWSKACVMLTAAAFVLGSAGCVVEERKTSGIKRTTIIMDGEKDTHDNASKNTTGTGFLK